MLTETDATVCSEAPSRVAHQLQTYHVVIPARTGRSIPLATSHHEMSPYDVREVELLTV